LLDIVNVGAAILGVAPCPGAFPYTEIAIIVNRPAAGKFSEVFYQFAR
jgi:hypothetical protein